MGGCFLLNIVANLLVSDGKIGRKSFDLPGPFKSGRILFLGGALC